MTAYRAAVVYNRREMEDGDFDDRMIVQLVRTFQASHEGLAVDGMCGPRTQRAIRAELEPASCTETKPWRGPTNAYPSSYASRKKVFGAPQIADSEWYRDNIVETFGQNRMPGMPGWQYIKVHRLVEPYAREGFRRAAQGSDYRVTRCGSWNLRSTRFAGGSWSSHAYGIAFDINPRQNKAIDFGELGEEPPEPWSERWMEIWPRGVDRSFVQAMASVGFRWGGRYSSFKDPMHFEWVGNLAWAEQVKMPLV